MSSSFRNTSVLRYRDQQTLLPLLCILVIFAGLVGYRARHRSPAVELAVVPPGYSARIALNRCDWFELCLLPGVGHTLARRIIADRRAHGPFTGPQDLQRVPGIGPKTSERLADQLDFFCRPPLDPKGDTEVTRPVH